MKGARDKEPITADKLSEYEILGILGRGGHSFVYKARCHKTGQIMAIKVIELSDKRARMQATQEASLHKTINHPHILRLLDYFCDESHCYLVLEYCEGGELYAHLQTKGGRLAENEVKSLLRQLIDAVSYLHSRRIVHRDLKLGNVLLTRDGQIKLSDFGLAIQLEGDEKVEDMVRGTPNYIAPEIVLAKRISPACDVWALGCLTFALINGKPPFDDVTSEKTLANALHRSVPFSKDTSPELNELIERMLDKTSSARPSIDEVAELSFFREKNGEHTESTMELGSELLAAPFFTREISSVKDFSLAKTRVDVKSLFESRRGEAPRSIGRLTRRNEPAPQPLKRAGSSRHSVQSEASHVNSFSLKKNSLTGITNPHSSPRERVPTQLMGIDLFKTISPAVGLMQLINKVNVSMSSLMDRGALLSGYIDTRFLEPKDYQTSFGKISVKRDGSLEMRFAKYKYLIRMPRQGDHIYFFDSVSGDLKYDFKIDSLPRKYHPLLDYIKDAVAALKAKSNLLSFEFRGISCNVDSASPYPLLTAQSDSGQFSVSYRFKSELIEIGSSGRTKQIGLRLLDLRAIDPVILSKIVEIFEQTHSMIKSLSLKP